MFRVSQDKDAALIVLTRCGKLYLKGQRVHHGLVGGLLAVTGVALHRSSIAAAGLALIAHDRHDFPFPLHDPDGWGTKQLGPGGRR